MNNKKITLGIDASRCRSGGAIAHLKGILVNLIPQNFNIDFVHIWSFEKLLIELPDYPWLIKHNPPILEKSLIKQFYWQTFILKNQLLSNKCDLLFTADAVSLCSYKPQVVLSQDLLSYEKGLISLHGYSKERLRLMIILLIQNYSFKKSEGVIFLTYYARNLIQKKCGILKNSIIIPHGVGDEFQLKLIKRNYNFNFPIKCLYISNALLYKYQWNVIKAIELLRFEGYQLTLQLIGGGKGKAQKMIENQISLSDPTGSFVEQLDFIPQHELPTYLLESDIFIFASSCEAFGITLLEAMASGIPIACSNRSCLPELLENGGEFFNPEDPISISIALKKLINDKQLCFNYSNNSKDISSKYTWSRCSNETFKFLTEIAIKYNKKTKK
jgi:glycosyltransferase involved in cell wall biosynthesis